jgi:RimJ/RimL family protein N-acetyltransferase
MIVPIDIGRDDQIGLWCTVWSTVRPGDGLTPLETRYESELDPYTECWLIRDIAGRPVGAVQLTDSRWTATTEPLEIEMATFPSADGAIPAILDAGCRRARELGASGLLVACRDVRADEALRRALESRRFVCADRDVEAVLDIEHAVTWETALPDGVRMTTLAHEPELTVSAHRCFTLADADEPNSAEATARPFAEWVREIESPWSSGDDCLIAVTDAGEVIGWANLERFAMSPDVGWNGFTGTHPDHRRRGIAGHLKQALLEHARRLGLRELRTENHEHNRAMRHINARMGYVPSHTNEWWRLDL